MVQMKEQIKTPVKELKNKWRQAIYQRQSSKHFIRMLKELSEDLSSIKKTQSETKDTLIEIKNDVQGNNSRVDEAKNQTSDLEHKEAKSNHAEQREEKRIKKMRIVKTASRGPIFVYRGARRRGERARNWKSI
ncbi:hypothetical protein HJG60_009360 [Phyllostomus discolor]|uniref:Uncharacterized protein n=1 Tax=Phyllostomus discolor TaxID=89673 RepID=A0A834D8S7_9CHIR|nr:hypothetical protein HJG60_009360 [Phyllostomus discolor]